MSFREHIEGSTAATYDVTVAHDEFIKALDEFIGKTCEKKLREPGLKNDNDIHDSDADSLLSQARVSFSDVVKSGGKSGSGAESFGSLVRFRKMLSDVKERVEKPAWAWHVLGLQWHKLEEEATAKFDEGVQSGVGSAAAWGVSKLLEQAVGVPHTDEWTAYAWEYAKAYAKKGSEVASKQAATKFFNDEHRNDSSLRAIVKAFETTADESLARATWHFEKTACAFQEVERFRRKLAPTESEVADDLKKITTSSYVANMFPKERESLIAFAKHRGLDIADVAKLDKYEIRKLREESPDPSPAAPSDQSPDPGPAALHQNCREASACALAIYDFLHHYDKLKRYLFPILRLQAMLLSRIEVWHTEWMAGSRPLYDLEPVLAHLKGHVTTCVDKKDDLSGQLAVCYAALKKPDPGGVAHDEPECPLQGRQEVGQATRWMREREVPIELSPSARRLQTIREFDAKLEYCSQRGVGLKDHEIRELWKRVRHGKKEQVEEVWQRVLRGEIAGVLSEPPLLPPRNSPQTPSDNSDAARAARVAAAAPADGLPSFWSPEWHVETIDSERERPPYDPDDPDEVRMRRYEDFIGFLNVEVDGDKKRAAKGESRVRFKLKPGEKDPAHVRCAYLLHENYSRLENKWFYDRWWNVTRRWAGWQDWDKNWWEFALIGGGIVVTIATAGMAAPAAIAIGAGSAAGKQLLKMAWNEASDFARKRLRTGARDSEGFTVGQRMGFSASLIRTHEYGVRRHWLSCEKNFLRMKYRKNTGNGRISNCFDAVGYVWTAFKFWHHYYKVQKHLKDMTFFNATALERLKAWGQYWWGEANPPAAGGAAGEREQPSRESNHSPAQPSGSVADTPKGYTLAPAGALAEEATPNYNDGKGYRQLLMDSILNTVRQEREWHFMPEHCAETSWMPKAVCKGKQNSNHLASGLALHICYAARDGGTAEANRLPVAPHSPVFTDEEALRELGVLPEHFRGGLFEYGENRFAEHLAGNVFFDDLAGRHAQLHDPGAADAPRAGSGDQG